MKYLYLYLSVTYFGTVCYPKNTEVWSQIRTDPNTEVSSPIRIRIFKQDLLETFCSNPGSDPGSPDPSLGCPNGVVNKIAPGPLVPEGLQKVLFKIRIRIGEDASVFGSVRI